MKVAVVDDEEIIRNHIRNLIEKHRPGCHMETYAAAEELLAAKEQFDIVFLDIKMEGLNGIEAAQRLRERNSYGIQEETVLIFVTGAREYVFEAFDVAAFHYLLKPPEEKKLIEVFDRAVKEAEKRKERGQRQLVLKTGGRSVTLKPDRILYIENRGRKLEIHTAVREERIEIYAAMSDLEGQLGSNFYRCHRGYLVNMAYITEYSNTGITLNNGETVYMAKDRYSKFVKEYMHYLKNGGVSFA